MIFDTLFDITYTFIFYTIIGIITTINAVALKEFYWDSIRVYVTQLQELHDLVKTWRLVFLIYFSMSIVVFKQWLNKTVIPLPDGRYILTHWLHGSLVKIVVKPVSKLPINVIDENNECYIEEALPFLRYEQEPFCNQTINVSTKLLVRY